MRCDTASSSGLLGEALNTQEEATQHPLDNCILVKALPVTR